MAKWTYIEKVKCRHISKTGEVLSEWEADFVTYGSTRCRERFYRLNFPMAISVQDGESIVTTLDFGTDKELEDMDKIDHFS